VASLGFGVTRGGIWRYHPYFSWKTGLAMHLFAHRCHFYWFHSGVTPWRVSPGLFLLVRPRLSTILRKFSHNFFRSGVTPCRVPPGAVRPLRSPTLVTPLVKFYEGQVSCVCIVKRRGRHLLLRIALFFLFLHLFLPFPRSPLFLRALLGGSKPDGLQLQHKVD